MVCSGSQWNIHNLIVQIECNTHIRKCLSVCIVPMPFQSALHGRSSTAATTKIVEQRELNVCVYRRKFAPIKREEIMIIHFIIVFSHKHTHTFEWNIVFVYLQFAHSNAIVSAVCFVFSIPLWNISGSFPLVTLDCNLYIMFSLTLGIVCVAVTVGYCRLWWWYFPLGIQFI